MTAAALPREKKRVGGRERERSKTHERQKGGIRPSERETGFLISFIEYELLCFGVLMDPAIGT